MEFGRTDNEHSGAGSVRPQVRIGHVHLKVADLNRAIAFYHGVLGFELTQRYGEQAAFLPTGATITLSGQISGKALADCCPPAQRGFITGP